MPFRAFLPVAVSRHDAVRKTISAALETVRVATRAILNDGFGGACAGAKREGKRGCCQYLHADGASTVKWRFWGAAISDQLGVVFLTAGDDLIEGDIAVVDLFRLLQQVKVILGIVACPPEVLAGEGHADLARSYLAKTSSADL
jgi:hypothetical protein